MRKKAGKSPKISMEGEDEDRESNSAEKANQGN